MTRDPSAYPRFRPTAPIEPRSALIEASAGTGKTYSITDLVLRLVAEHRVPLPQILVVTFTRAATSELRDRVRRRLVTATREVERAVAEPGWDPDDLDDRLVAWLITEGRAGPDGELEARLDALRRAREEFDEATISTIHGFCQETLRRSAFESDIDLGAQLVEDVSDLLEEVTHDYIVRELRDASPTWYRYLRDQKVNKETLLAVAYAVEAEPHVSVLPEPREGPAPREVWESAIGGFRHQWETGAGELIDWLHGLCEDKAIKPTYKPDRIATNRQWLDRWVGEGGVDELEELSKRVAYFSRSSVEDKLKETAPLPEPELLDRCEEMLRLLTLPASLVKSHFAAHLREEAERRKVERAVLSFNDLLRSLADTLERPSVGEALRDSIQERFQAALIDEFQDTDPVQWRIFREAFGRDAWMYLIGDPKQAIYSFRGADVHTYLEAAERHVGDDARYTLETNWRSDARFVRALNHLLAQPGIFGTQRIAYVEVNAADEHVEDRLRFPDGPRAALDIAFFPRALAGKEGSAAIPKTDFAWPQLPVHVADEIVELLESGAQVHDEDLGQRRDVEPRDIAVLTRTNDQAAAVQRALIDAGVHAVTTGGGNVFASDEADLMQRLLDALLRPSSERDVKSALSTPLFGVDAAELVTMPERRWEDWLETLSAWAAAWREDGIARMLRRAFAEGGVAARMLALPNGERRLTNVLHLVELLHRAETEHRLGPTAVTAWLRTQRHEEEAADEHELRLESDEEAVQVVTIHRAKGLEFPIVWLPYLWDGLLLRGRTTDLRLHHPETGELILDLNVDNKLEPSATFKRYAEEEAWQENLRLAYVALTRAKHRCVVYWGAFSSAGTSSLAHILHGSSIEVGDDGHPSCPRSNLQEPDEELLAQLRALESRAEATIAVREVGEITDEPRWSQSRSEAAPLRTRAFGRRGLDVLWRRTSFSSLTREPRDDEPREGSPAAEGIDRDPETSRSVSVADRPGGPQVPLADFPRGARAGTFLHDVLEHLDFAHADDVGAVEATITGRLDRHALGDVDAPGLARALQEVLLTPLGAAVPGTRLADIGLDDRLDELSFDLTIAGGYTPPTPAAAISLPALAAVFEAHGEGTATPLGSYAATLRSIGLPRASRGYLTGAIDLVFRAEVDGRPRYFIADHKSNWLGDRGTGRLTVDHYRPEALRHEMDESHYVLQYHLYILALHRYLRWRLGSTYDYDRDVGGALYLFLRGMVGPGTPQERGVTYGVYADRPSAALIDDLDALFRHEDGGGR